MTPLERAALLNKLEADKLELAADIEQRKRDREMRGLPPIEYESRPKARVNKSADDLLYRTQQDAVPNTDNISIKQPTMSPEVQRAWDAWARAHIHLALEEITEQVNQALADLVDDLATSTREYIDSQVGGLRADLQVEKAAKVIDLPDFRRRA